MLSYSPFLHVHIREPRNADFVRTSVAWEVLWPRELDERLDLKLIAVHARQTRRHLYRPLAREVGEEPLFRQLHASRTVPLVARPNRLLPLLFENRL